ncbi:unnamed protein product, partial [Sphagnum troendelagicum]
MLVSEEALSMCVRFMLSTLCGIATKATFAQEKHAILLPLVAKELTRIFGTALHF